MKIKRTYIVSEMIGYFTITGDCITFFLGDQHEVYDFSDCGEGEYVSSNHDSSYDFIIKGKRKSNGELLLDILCFVSLSFKQPENDYMEVQDGDYKMEN